MERGVEVAGGVESVVVHRLVGGRRDYQGSGVLQGRVEVQGLVAVFGVERVGGGLLAVRGRQVLHHPAAGFIIYWSGRKDQDRPARGGVTGTTRLPAEPLYLVLSSGNTLLGRPSS